MSKQEIRVRFAPSPTGSLHLGGARTAIYNWLFARSNQGKFLLRIEDTDSKRSQPELVDQIMESLQWLGLSWDEPPVYQSKRLNIYQKYLQQLLTNKSAFYCTCSPPATECNCFANQRKIVRNLSHFESYTVKFKVPAGKTRWQDKIYGKIEVDNQEIDDFVILRSNGMPTYQLAVVVDDLEMKISHVIRGEDHISNTPKQILLIQAFDKSVPVYAHLPLLFGSDGKRLSKRHGASGVDEFKAMGFPSVAVFNYLALLGWSPKNGREVMNSKAILNHFSLNNISKKAAIFDMKKLEWISNQHFKQFELKDIRPELCQGFKEAGYISDPENECENGYVTQVVKLLKNRARTYEDIKTWARYFFFPPEEFDKAAVAKNWSPELIKKLLPKLQDIESWKKEIIEQAVRETATENEIKAGQVIHPFRLAITGYEVSPDIFLIAEMIDKESTLLRLNNALKTL
ncbi:MAG: glutamate--tRNA ligase [Fidelibacterota bacterium]